MCINTNLKYIQAKNDNNEVLLWFIFNYLVQLAFHSCEKFSAKTYPN